MENKILVVDDEADLTELISYNLGREGYTVEKAYDGETALVKVRQNSYDLLILDLMLPGIQGLDLCRVIRNDARTAGLPIIMLTAKGEELDRVLGLEMGADDYMTKPFSPRELSARVRAVLRRASQRGQSGGGQVLRTGDLEIDRERYAVAVRGAAVKLSATEYRLLVYLAERSGRVFSRGQLLDAVWSDEAFVEPRTVDVHIRRLRAQIEEDPSHPRYIKTRRGIGYYFEGGK